MNEFEVRYNAMEQVMLLTIQRLMFEVAKTKGDEASTWIDVFRNAVVTEINDTMNTGSRARQPRPTEISKTAISVVEGLATMTKARLAEQQ